MILDCREAIDRREGGTDIHEGGNYTKKMLQTAVGDLGPDGRAGENLPAAATKPWSNLASGAGDTFGEDHDLSHPPTSKDCDASEPSGRMHRAIPVSALLQNQANKFTTLAREPGEKAPCRHCR
jgi:hypothetical protein